MSLSFLHLFLFLSLFWMLFYIHICKRDELKKQNPTIFLQNILAKRNLPPDSRLYFCWCRWNYRITEIKMLRNTNCGSLVRCTYGKILLELHDSLLVKMSKHWIPMCLSVSASNFWKDVVCILCFFCDLFWIFFFIIIVFS